MPLSQSPMVTGANATSGLGGGMSPGNAGWRVAERISGDAAVRPVSGRTPIVAEISGWALDAATIAAVSRACSVLRRRRCGFGSDSNIAAKFVRAINGSRYLIGPSIGTCSIFSVIISAASRPSSCAEAASVAAAPGLTGFSALRRFCNAAVARSGAAPMTSSGSVLVR
jgi:hypothetical protein